MSTQASGTEDCRTIEGETVGLVDAAIHILRIVARSDNLSSPVVVEALRDFAADPEVQFVITAARLTEGG